VSEVSGGDSIRRDGKGRAAWCGTLAVVAYMGWRESIGELDLVGRETLGRGE